MKIVYQASLPLFLTWVSLVINILFRSQPNGNCQFGSAFLSSVGENSLDIFRVMAIVELHVNATFYDEHPDTLKSVYEKSQSIMDGKLFSSYLLLKNSVWTSTGSSRFQN